jgi:hypothetical protein
MKIIEGRFQYTAIDDCTRLRVLGLYPRHTASDAVHFLENRILEEFPFPIQRIQTDQGAECFGATFQYILRRYCITVTQRARLRRSARPKTSPPTEIQVETIQA